VINPPVKTWAEIDALKAELNRRVIEARQTLRVSREDRFVNALTGGRLTVLVDAKGRPIS